MVFVSCVGLGRVCGREGSPTHFTGGSPHSRSSRMPVQIERGVSVPAEQIVEARGGHGRYWRPPSFGLEGAWNDGRTMWATWTDGTCREVTVVAADRGRSLVAMSGPRVGPWVVAVDAPGCGNQALRSANCLDYYAAVTTGVLGSTQRA